jgi:hypothetical protein
LEKKRCPIHHQVEYGEPKINKNGYFKTKQNKRTPQNECIKFNILPLFAVQITHQYIGEFNKVVN